MPSQRGERSYAEPLTRGKGGKGRRFLTARHFPATLSVVAIVFATVLMVLPAPALAYSLLAPQGTGAVPSPLAGVPSSTSGPATGSGAAPLASSCPNYQNAGVLSIYTVVDCAYAAGFRGNSVIMITAMAYRESGFDDDESNGAGILQEYDNVCSREPLCAFQLAYQYFSTTANAGGVGCGNNQYDMFVCLWGTYAGNWAYHNYYAGGGWSGNWHQIPSGCSSDPGSNALWGGSDCEPPGLYCYASPVGFPGVGQKSNAALTCGTYYIQNNANSPCEGSDYNPGMTCNEGGIWRGSYQQICSNPSWYSNEISCSGSGTGGGSLSVSYSAQIGSNQIHCGASFVSGTTVTFAASVSGGSGSYTDTWNFGDGTSDGHGTPVSHTYSYVGSVNPMLSVTDSQGTSGSSGSGCTFTVTSGSTTTVNGIDVSSYQYQPNWATVASSGVKFAWAKATQGNYYQDADFNYDMANGKAAGVIMGAYDFADPDNVAATTEAAYFESFAGGYFKAGYLVPALDIETGCSGAGNGNLGATQITSWVDTWAANVASYIQTHDGYSVKPIIYTYTSYASSCLTSSVTTYPLWMAWPYTSSPPTAPWASWDVWQYGTTSVPGVSTATDVDRFNGDLSQLQSTLVIGGSSSGGGGTQPSCPNLAAPIHPSPAAPDQASVPSSSVGTGYWLVGGDGGVFTFGNAGFYGSTASQKLNGCIVGMAATPDGKGYWLVGSDGGVFAFGDAGFYGSMGGKSMAAPVVGMAATPDGKGYWLVGGDGGVFTFGDAKFYGSLPGQNIHVSNIVGMAALPDGQGYWLVGSDGGVFSFGSAAFYGSMGGKSLAAPVVGMATPDGKGYWLVAADGGVFSFGSAAFYGSMGGKHLNAPVTGMASTPDGKGYWLVAADGGVFSFGSAPFFGSMGGKSLAAPMIGMAAVPQSVNGVPVDFTATSQSAKCGSGCNIWSTASLKLSVTGPSGSFGPFTTNSPAVVLQPGTQYTVTVSIGSSAYSVGSWSVNNYASVIVTVGGVNQKYTSSCGSPSTSGATSATSALLDTGTAWSTGCQASPPLGEHVNVNLVNAGGGTSQCTQATAIPLGQVVTGSLANGGCALFSVAVTQSDWDNWGFVDAYEEEGSGVAPFVIDAGMSPPTVSPGNAKAVVKGPDAAVSVPLNTPQGNAWMGWGTYEFLVSAPSGGGSYCFVAYLSNLASAPSASCANHLSPAGHPSSPADSVPRTLSVAFLPGMVVPVTVGLGWFLWVALSIVVGTVVGFVRYHQRRRTATAPATSA